jgi:general secretion pathway protein G
MKTKTHRPSGLVRRNPARRDQGGFTLIEILVVLAIIGLLVGVLVTKSDKIFGRSQTAVAGIFVRNSASVPLLSYRRDMGDYPSTQEGLQALVTAPGTRADSWHGPYMDAPGGRLPVDPWGEPYQYRYPGTKNVGGYDLYSKGPDKQPDTGDDIGNW